MPDLYKANYKAAAFDLFLMYDWLACLSLSPPLSVTSPDQAEQVERCMRLSRRLLVVMTAVGSCGGQGVAPPLDEFDWQMGVHSALVQETISVIVVQVEDEHTHTKSQNLTHTQLRTRTQSDNLTHLDTHTQLQKLTHTHLDTHTHSQNLTHLDTHTQSQKLTHTHWQTHTVRKSLTHTAPPWPAAAAEEERPHQVGVGSARSKLPHLTHLEESPLHDATPTTITPPHQGPETKHHPTHLEIHTHTHTHHPTHLEINTHTTIQLI